MDSDEIEKRKRALYHMSERHFHAKIDALCDRKSDL